MNNQNNSKQDTSLYSSLEPTFPPLPSTTKDKDSEDQSQSKNNNSKNHRENDKKEQNKVYGKVHGNEQEDEIKQNSSKTYFNTHFVHFSYGDWFVDLNTMELINQQFNETIPLKSLNNNKKFMKLFCAIGIKPSWDIQGLMKVLNHATQTVFGEDIEQVLLQSIETDGKKIDWSDGTIGKK